MSLIGEDCHYFVTSTCTRGSQCCFRHQPAARTTELPCPEWIQGKCLNPNCNLRHVSVDRTRNKGATPCFYESQPNGCLNPLCKFLHVNSKPINAVEPVATNPVQNVAVDVPVMNNNTASIIPPSVVPKVSHKPIIIANTIKPQIKLPNMLPPPAPVHSLGPPAGTASIVNGVLTIAPARGILGANPNQVAQILPPLLTQHHNGIRQQQQQITTNQHFVTHTIPFSGQQNPLPETGNFSEQVRLFKEMLNSKQRLNDLKAVSKNNIKQYHNDDHSDYDSDKEDKRYKEKYNKRRNKKEKNVRHKKKSKDDLSKADQEVLYGDYKDIPIEKKHKKSREHRYPHSDTDVTVKSYEEILREKALRKMIEAKRQKEQFDDDFEEIIGEKNQKSKNKKSDETNESKIPKKIRKESLDLDNVVFDKADALEIGVGEDELNELNGHKNEKKQFSKSSKERKDSSEKENIDSAAHSPKNETKAAGNDIAEGEEELDYNDDYISPDADVEGILVIPDETTDLTFSVDETDDLALELNQAPEEGVRKEKRKPSRHVKKASNVVSHLKSSSRDDRSNRNRHSDRTSSKQKRNIMVIEEVSPDSKKIKDNSDKNTESAPKKVVALVHHEKDKKRNEPVAETVVIAVDKLAVKVKTFEEIMEEKRKRKLMKQDIVVVSDSENLESPDKKPKKPLFTEKSETTSVKVDLPKPKTIAMLRKERLQLAKQDYEKRRKSMQIYQVKGSSSEAQPSAQPGKTAQPVKTNADRIKPPPPIKPARTTTTKSLAATITTTTTTIKPTVATKPITTTTKESNSNGINVTVRSFEEIMQEKRLRKQHEMPTQQKKIDAKPIQSFLRRRSLSNQRNNAASVTAETRTVNQDNDVPKPDAPSPVVAVESQIAEVKQASSPPVAKIIGRRRSSSPNVVPGPSESKVAPVKIKRNLSSSDVKSSPSPNSFTINKAVLRSKTSESSETMIKDSLGPKSIENTDEQSNDVFTSERKQPKGEEGFSQASIEDIQEALEERKRQHEKDTLSDEEFEKEMNDLLSDGDDVSDDDSNDDDFMMELEQMIDN